MVEPAGERARYAQYDKRVDLVSIFEVWFKRSAGLAKTVQHFERFPQINHPDGRPATPDFTVLFTDGTTLIGEISSVPPEAVDDAIDQILRYDGITEVPAARRSAGGQQLTHAVTEVDLMLITPLNGSNATCDRVEARIDSEGISFQHPPTVLAWSFDSPTGAYTFVRPTRAGNGLPREHGRKPSIGSWLAEGSDELRGLPIHFAPLKAASRFMNDEPPELYTATVLWSSVFPDILVARGLPASAEFEVTVDEIGLWLLNHYGFSGATGTVRRTLGLLRVGGLAEEGPDGRWKILYTDLGRLSREIEEAILHLINPPGGGRRDVRRVDPPETPTVEQPKLDG